MQTENKNKKWVDTDTNYLVKGVELGKSIKELATDLQRTEEACFKQLSRVRLGKNLRAKKSIELNLWTEAELSLLENLVKTVGLRDCLEISNLLIKSGFKPRLAKSVYNKIYREKWLKPEDLLTNTEAGAAEVVLTSPLPKFTPPTTTNNVFPPWSAVEDETLKGLWNSNVRDYSEFKARLPLYRTECAVYSRLNRLNLNDPSNPFRGTKYGLSEIENKKTNTMSFEEKLTHLKNVGRIVREYNALTKEDIEDFEKLSTVFTINQTSSNTE